MLLRAFERQGLACHVVLLLRMDTDNDSYVKDMGVPSSVSTMPLCGCVSLIVDGELVFSMSTNV